MRMLIQRVSQASVTVAGAMVGQISQGLLVLVGVGHADSALEAQLLAQKTAQLRVFNDADGRFNLSLLDTGGQALVVSQFTLFADTRRGRRPGFAAAARPEIAAPLVEAYAAALRDLGVHVETGRFGTHMEVALVNDGPVTIWLDSKGT
ncbi:MAG: D-tyrosyl-tRNA(Tyr) deacylase [Roseiflexaceae bacterium]|nr:D-tyrosyl-tRNA(Tyr) deacylase [Roseiflexaceae bacterium]